MNEDIVIPIAGMVMVIVICIGVPLVIALGKKWQNQATQPRVPSEIAERLARMEQAIDAVAIEVERISEGQRFTTKLLSERQRDPLPVPARGQES
jgi:hypothetical protein